jgi:hypothetical protein
MSKVIPVLLVIAALTVMLVLTPTIGGLDDADAKRKKIKQVDKCGGNTQCNNVAVQIKGNHKSVSNSGDD